MNSGHAVYGLADLAKALQVSDDGFFYNLGVSNADSDHPPQGGPIQDWAHKFGIGRKTGIDLPGEEAGTLPDRLARPAQQRGRVRPPEPASADARYGVQLGPTEAPG